MVQHILFIDKTPIAYTLKVSTKAKRIRLVVRPDCTLTVTIPKRAHANEVPVILVKKGAWILGALEKMKKISDSLPPKPTRKEYLLGKKNCLRLIKNRIEYFNQQYNFVYNKVTIKNQKTRWGSCSRNKNLNFNYKVVKLPPHLADYIVVHELCHLKELNHSQRFWDLVAQTLPGYKLLRLELRTRGVEFY